MRKFAIVVVVLAFISFNAFGANLHINCGSHRTLGAALASIDPTIPNTIHVSGTCNEVIDIQQFDHLTIIGEKDAVIASSSTTAYTFTVRSSHDVAIRNLTVRGGSFGALYFESCKDCSLYNSIVEGLFVMGSLSKAVAFKDVFHANTWAGIGVFDNSVLFLNDSSLDTANSAWAGVAMFKGAEVTVGGTTVQNFAVGFNVDHSTLDISNGYVWELPTSNPDQTVLIQNTMGPAISVFNGGTANLTSVARLQNNGSMWWSAAIQADGNSTIDIQDGAEISNSATDGIRLTWGAHATIGAAKILNYGKNCCGSGISLTDNSTASVSSGNGNLVISGGPGPDIFCDDSGRLGGVSYISASTISCDHAK